MLLILKFQSADSEIQFWALIPPSGESQIYDQHPDSCEEFDQWQQMTLINLVDRDDILADTEEARQVECKGKQGSEEQDADDNYAVEEMQKYFDISLLNALGPPNRYNPFAIPSRKIDSMVLLFISIIYLPNL